MTNTFIGKLNISDSLISKAKQYTQKISKNIYLSYAKLFLPEINENIYGFSLSTSYKEAEEKAYMELIERISSTKFTNRPISHQNKLKDNKIFSYSCNGYRLKSSPSGQYFKSINNPQTIIPIEISLIALNRNKAYAKITGNNTSSLRQRITTSGIALSKNIQKAKIKALQELIERHSILYWWYFASSATTINLEKYKHVALVQFLVNHTANYTTLQISKETFVTIIFRNSPPYTIFGFGSHPNQESAIIKSVEEAIMILVASKIFKSHNNPTPVEKCKTLSDHCKFYMLSNYNDLIKKHIETSLKSKNPIQILDQITQNTIYVILGTWKNYQTVRAFNDKLIILNSNQSYKCIPPEIKRKQNIFNNLPHPVC